MNRTAGNFMSLHTSIVHQPLVEVVMGYAASRREAVIPPHSEAAIVAATVLPSSFYEIIDIQIDVERREL
jgi:hypothetical protein